MRDHREMLWSLFPSPAFRARRIERGTRRGTRFWTNGVAPGRGTRTGPTTAISGTIVSQLRLQAAAVQPLPLLQPLRKQLLRTDKSLAAIESSGQPTGLRNLGLNPGHGCRPHLHVIE